MNTHYSIVFYVSLCILLLSESSTGIDSSESVSLEKEHEEYTVKRKSNFGNDKPPATLGLGGHREVKDILPELMKAVKGLQGEYDLLNKALSKQRTNVEEMDQNLLAFNSDVNEIKGSIVFITGTVGRLLTDIKVVENDTKKLEATLSNINTLVQELLSREEERALQITRLETVTNQLREEISLKSLNNTIQDLISASINSNNDELQKQITALKSALENNNAAYEVQLAQKKAADGLQVALKQISELREKCVSKDELNQLLQNVTSTRGSNDGINAINKCTVNVRHEPKQGRTHLRLVMDPPNTGCSNCNLEP